MGWNVKQLDNGDVELTDDQGGANAPAVIFGRGTTDTDVTFLALRNSDGELTYILPNAAQNAIVVQAGRP